MKFKVGRFYVVQFDDHSLGNLGVIRCYAAGWLISKDRKSITLAYWMPVINSKKLRDDNMEFINIVRKTIAKSDRISSKVLDSLFRLSVHQPKDPA